MCMQYHARLVPRPTTVSGADLGTRLVSCQINDVTFIMFIQLADNPQLLIYTDGEQQDLLHAAEIIQNAFRKYKVSAYVQQSSSSSTVRPTVVYRGS